MDHQDLLSRVRDLAATSEGLDQLLGQIGAALEDGGGGLDGDGPARADVAPYLLRAREALAASGRLVAASEAVRGVLVPSSRALVAAARESRNADQARVARTATALARSQALLGRAGEEAKRRPAPHATVAVAKAAFLLAKLEGHGRLPDEERAALAGAVGRARHASAGSELVREGSSPAESTLLLDGVAARCKALRGGERQITAVHVPGDFVDLHSLLLQPTADAAVAMTGCTVAAVPHEALRRVADAYPNLARLLWLDTLVDGAIHREWLVGMGRRSALGHMAHLLCELYLRLRAVGLAEGRPGGAFRFSLPLVQADLADVLGLSTVHVNRTLRELRAQGLATRVGSEVTVQDWDGLVRVAEFNPAYLNLPREPR